MLKSDDYYNKRKKDLENLKTKYENAGTISWKEYYSSKISNKVVLLNNTDFYHGTLRITKPCMLRLTENIIFNPNRPVTWIGCDNNQVCDIHEARKIDPDRKLDWFPDTSAPNNDQYFENDVKFAYGLGFFAAIAIETKDVILDLNGCKIEQHLEHSIQQRFYAHIELADQPFMPLQGPSNFGFKIKSAVNTFIINGEFGRSSHHGIHGNNGSDLFMENIRFSDHEVAAISLNGFKNVVMMNVISNNNLHNIPILSTYSAARFAKLFVKAVEEKGHSTPQLEKYKKRLYQKMDRTFNYIIFKKGKIPKLFANQSKLIDAIAYGFLFHSSGVAINKFMEGRNSSKSSDSSNIHMINCVSGNIKANPIEIIMLSNPNGGIQVDTAGAVIQFFDGIAKKDGEKYYHHGTALSNLQFELARIKQKSIDTRLFGTLNIHPGLLLWKDNSKYYFKQDDKYIILFDDNDKEIKNAKYEILCNGDSMAHVHKGVIGIRVDGVNGMSLINCNISGVDNQGEKGSTIIGGYIKSHPEQGNKMIGYHGIKSYGMTLSAINNFCAENLQIFDISSKNGSSTGVAIMNGSQNSHLKNLCLDNISSCNGGTFSLEESILPNELPLSNIITISKDCHYIDTENIVATNINNHPDNPFSAGYIIGHNPENKLAIH